MFIADYCFLLSQEKHVPGPAPDVLMLRVVNLRAIAKMVAVLISPFGFFVVERNGVDAEIGQRVQLCHFGNSVVVGVLPESQA